MVLILLAVAGLAGGLWALWRDGPHKDGAEISTGPFAAPQEAVTEQHRSGDPSAVPDLSAVEVTNRQSRGGRVLPEHSSFLALTVEVSPGGSGGGGGARLLQRAEHPGRCKPAPAGEGRVGIFFRAIDPQGRTISDGMLPDPFEIRAFPARPERGETPLSAPIPRREAAEILLRLPVTPELRGVELFHVPATAKPDDARDKTEWRIGTITL